MARANFVKKALKDNPAVKRGEPYFWWKFRYGGKHYSKTHPRASQLTQSDFMGAVLSAEEEIEDLDSNMERDDIASTVSSVVDSLRELADEQSEKRSNMPDSLQDGDTGQLLEGREQSANDMADEYDQVDLDNESLEDIIDELQQITYQGE